MDPLITLYWVPAIPTTTTSHKWQTQLLRHHTNQPHLVIDRCQAKPKAPDPMEYSVTHSQHHMAGIWVMGITTSTPMGIDVESIHRYIPKSVMHRGRKNQWIPSDTPLNRVLKWTQFEASAKLTGQGIRFPIPEAFSSHHASFVWQDWLVTVASPVPVPSVRVVPLPLDQNGYPMYDAPLQLLDSFVLTWESSSKTTIPAVADDTNAPDPMVLNGPFSIPSATDDA